MGLLVTFVDSLLAGYDAVPDVVGWALVVLGLRDLRGRLATSTTLLPLAAVAGAVSVVLLRPAWTAGLPESTGWLLSLPQLVFSFVLCREVARLLAPEGGSASAPGTTVRESHTLGRRLAWLGRIFLVAATGPVLVYGGGLDRLLTPVAVLAVAANVLLVYLLFRASPLVHGARPTHGPPAGQGD